MVFEAATKLLARGISVIPVAGKRAVDKDAAKKPIIPWQDFQKRLASESEVKNWFSGEVLPDLAVVTGKISKLLVLDVDSKEALPDQYKLPLTWTAATKRGRHYYFRWTSELDGAVTTKVGVLPNVDVRGEGGYVIAPPSKGFNGTPYRWERGPGIVPLANPPEWLVKLLVPARLDNLQPVNKSVGSSALVRPGTSWLAETLAGIKEGNRNATFTKIAGSLRARGYSGDDIFQFLLPRAKEVSFSEAELRAVCASVARYAPNERKENVVGPQPDGSRGVDSVDSGVIANSIDAFLEDNETVEWLCEPIIAKQSIGFVAGMQKTGKTWMMIDLAVEMARGGGKWLGRFPVKGAKVLFIDQERFRGETQRRFRAVIAGKNLVPKDLKGSLYIRCGTTTRIDLENSYLAFKREVAEIKPDVIIIDSFATFHTKEENNRAEIQAVLERVKAIRNEFGCSIIFIDHENKGVFHDKETKEPPSAIRLAGSVAKPAAAEFVLIVRRQDGSSSFVYHTDSTLAPCVAPFLCKVDDLNEEKTKIRVGAF